MHELNITNVITEELSGKRLDQALACIYPEYSREKLKEWLLSGSITIDGKSNFKPKDKVKGGEKVHLKAVIEKAIKWEAEDIKLDIVYEDDDIIVVNKPSNLVVHPAAGNPKGTLVNALLNHAPDLEKLPRAGIVHRIDKDTTGLLVVAKTLTAHTSLVRQLQDKSVYRVYEAVISGSLVTGGIIDKPIGRHPRDRKKMAVNKEGKPAITHYRLIKKFPHNTHVKIQLETGRTHQIRVHFANNKTPIVGDQTYGRRTTPKGLTQEARDFINNFPRQALHAKELGLVHPKTNENVKWEIDLPQDMQDLLKYLEG